MKKDFSFTKKAEIDTSSEVISKYMKTVSEMVSNASIKLSEYMKPIFINYQKNIRKILDEFKVDETLAKKFLKKYQLFLTPSMDVRLISELARIGKKRGKHTKEINRLLGQYYFGNNLDQVDELFEQWEKSDLFQPRMRIFRDCLITLRSDKKKYNPINVVLPTLIAQIDGIRQCFLEKKGYTKIVKKDKWLDSRGISLYWKEIYAGFTPGDTYLSEANKFFTSVLFGGSDRGVPSLIGFNRHKIIHGENTKYGSVRNLIRTILILDFLYYLDRQP